MADLAEPTWVLQPVRVKAEASLAERRGTVARLAEGRLLTPSVRKHSSWSQARRTTRRKPTRVVGDGLRESDKVLMVLSSPAGIEDWPLIPAFIWRERQSLWGREEGASQCPRFLCWLGSCRSCLGVGWSAPGLLSRPAAGGFSGLLAAG